MFICIILLYVRRISKLVIKTISYNYNYLIYGIIQLYCIMYNYIIYGLFFSIVSCLLFNFNNIFVNFYRWKQLASGNVSLLFTIFFYNLYYSIKFFLVTFDFLFWTLSFFLLGQYNFEIYPHVFCANLIYYNE